MKTHEEYNVVPTPRLVRDWTNKLVRSRGIVRNGLGEMPAGTLFRITNSGARKSLRSLPCDRCGFSLLVSVSGKREDFEREFQFVEICNAETGG